MHIWKTKCSIDEFEKESEKGTFNIFYLELIRNPGSTVEFVRFSLAAFFLCILKQNNTFKIQNENRWQVSCYTIMKIVSENNRSLNTVVVYTDVILIDRVKYNEMYEVSMFTRSFSNTL